MNTQIIITLSDFGRMILWAAFFVILLYMIFILRKIYISIKDFSKVVQENRNNIDKILDSAPGITKNLENISADLASDVAAFNGTVSNISSITEKITSIKNIKNVLSKEKDENKE